MVPLITRNKRFNSSTVHIQGDSLLLWISMISALPEKFFPQETWKKMLKLILDSPTLCTVFFLISFPQKDF